MRERPARPNNYMWRVQTGFLEYTRSAFKEILDELRCKLDHSFFLVGFQIDEDAPDSAVVRLDPERPGKLESALEEMFHCLKGGFQPWPVDDDDDEAWRAAVGRHQQFCSELRTGVCDVLEAEPDFAGYIAYCSLPTQINSHLVSLVLLVSRSDYESHPRLEDEARRQQEGLLTSFLSAICEVFLEQYSPGMTKSDQDVHLFFTRRDPRELLHNAGSRFAQIGARPGAGGVTGSLRDPSFVVKYGTYDLFQVCNVISSLNYEGEAAVGCVVVSERGHPAIDVQIELVEPVDPDDFRKVRKLLEMCDERVWLLAADRRIYGLGSLNHTGYDRKREDVFVIRFVEHHCWEFIHNGVVLMRTTYNEPKLPLPRFDDDELRASLKRCLPGIHRHAVDRVTALGRMASSAKRGTILVVSAEAEDEAERLGKQSFPVKPFAMTTAQLASVCAIDGAILLDAEAKCHALGVILDGVASREGDSARGARYNSAVRYVEVHPNCVAIVVSEDGTVDIVVKQWSGLETDYER